MRGIATLYATPNMLATTGIEADLKLPLRPSNKSWYATWIMLVPEGDRYKVPFAQVGLIVWSERGPQPVPFVEYRDWKGDVHLMTFPRTSTVARAYISMKHDSIILGIGARKYANIKTSLLFPTEAPLYFQLGDEVSSPLDALSGEITSIAIVFNGEKVRYEPFCYRIDNGLRLQKIKEGWSGSGEFQPTAGDSLYAKLSHCSKL